MRRDRRCLRSVVLPLWLTSAVVLAPAAAAQEAVSSLRTGVYLIEDGANGIHLSDQSRSAADRLLIAAESGAGDSGRPRVARSISRDAAIDHAVQQAALAQSLDPLLLHAVIATESGYAVRAVSRRGALGLMQLMPATARQYGVTDPFDVAQNIGAGALHLRKLFDRFEQNPVLALAAYNAGVDAVVRSGSRIPPFAETQAYVPRVLQRFATLGAGPGTEATRGAARTPQRSAL